MSYSLYELNEYIRQVLALNFPDALWVRCELAQVKYSRGHCYLDLVEKTKEGGEIIAQAKAAIWAFQLRALRQRPELQIDALLQEGMEVLLLVKVEFHERFGLKYFVQDIDPAYTLGQLAMKRRQTLLQLKKEGWLEKNKKLALPAVIQKIAILSSESAAGLQDFLNEMSGNEFGYVFRFHLFPVAMQGAKVAGEITRALKKINPNHFDAIVIIRGGGSKLDLVAFDDYDLCKTVANAPLPVLCGIGHEVDDTVLDQVAARSLKTPTAVAGFIIHHNLRFESQIVQLAGEINTGAVHLLQSNALSLQRLSQSLQMLVQNQVARERMMIGFITKELPALFAKTLNRASDHLRHLDHTARLLGPEMTLKRGFTITRKNGRTITDKTQLEKGDEIETIFYKNKIKSVVGHN